MIRLTLPSFTNLDIKIFHEPQIEAIYAMIKTQFEPWLEHFDCQYTANFLNYVVSIEKIDSKLKKFWVNPCTCMDFEI
jgi:hypothetical protein